MAVAPMFVLPGATPENQEVQYAYLAKRCCCDVPNLNARIYSITFTREGVEWKATVGELLTGISRTRRDEPRMIDSDGTTVSAIFAGNPYQVCTTNGLPRQWANPFLAEPHANSVIYFSS